MPALPTSTRRRITRVAESGARRVLPPPDPAGRRVVLCYHSVDPQPSYLGLTPDLYDAHLAWLEEHCQVVGLDELVARVFVSESLVRRLSHALRDDASLAQKLTGQAVVKPDA